LPLSIAGAWVALDAARVAAIIGASTPVPIPGLPPFVPGVIAFRGRAVPALDLGALLGAAPPLGPGEGRARTVVLDLGGDRRGGGASLLAVPADAVREVVEATRGEILADGGAPPFVEGRVLLFGAPAPILDVRRAFPAYAALS
jgi:chemotaxis signal transduction protein